MKFDWDAQKAETNLGKHGVSFDEESTVFQDGFSLTGRDPDHYSGNQIRHLRTIVRLTSAGCVAHRTGQQNPHHQRLEGYEAGKENI
jgi:uncharacterized DUF497 family protein